MSRVYGVQRTQAVQKRTGVAVILLFRGCSGSVGTYAVGAFVHVLLVVALTGRRTLV